MDVIFNIDSSKIVDNMQPYEFRFKKNDVFKNFTLPLTKYNEQYFVLRQQERQYNTADNSYHYHYYIINNKFEVIGRFDTGYYMDLEDSCGITYHIVDEYQNRGIGQTVLGFVISDMLENHNVGKFKILPINDRSVAIALKNGFTQRSKRIYELNALDYQELQTKALK